MNRKIFKFWVRASIVEIQTLETVTKIVFFTANTYNVKEGNLIFANYKNKCDLNRNISDVTPS